MTSFAFPFRRNRARKSRGSTLIVTIGSVTILALGAAHVCRTVTSRYRSLYQADAWHEALASAEAGADLAIATLSSGKWDGWSAADANGVRTYNLAALTHGGDGNAVQSAFIAVDSPASFNTSAGKYYRIRSTGKANVSGGGYVGFDAYDTILRKLTLRRDRDTGAQVTTPSVSRTIEVIARGAAVIRRPLLLTSKFTPKSSTALIDSFDSEDPTKSTNGLYDVAKRQSNGDIILNDSNGTDLAGMTIYGKLGYMGPTIPNMQNVKGQITRPQSEKVLPVLKPTWTTVDSSLGAVTSGGTIASGPVGAPKRYKMSSVKLGSGSNVTFAESAPGQGGEIEVWVTGDMELSGSAQLIIPKGVKVTVWFEGNMKATGSMATNHNGVATSMTFNGVTPADGTTRTITMGGGSSTIAAFNAPAYDINIDGGGTFYGGFIGKTLSFNNGKGEVHYDEALSRQGGAGGNYTAVSFTEDVR